MKTLGIGNGRRIAWIFCAGLLALAISIPHPKANRPFTVGVGIWPGAESLILARAKGAFSSEEVQIVEMTWPSAAMRALANGAVDAAVLSLDEALRMRDAGHALRVVLVFDESISGDAVIGKEAIQATSSLKGARVGVDLRTSGMFLLAAALETGGLGVAEVRIVPLSQSEMGAALEEDQVDVVVASYPELVRLTRSGYRLLFEAKDAGIPLLRVLVVSESSLENYRAEIEKVVSAHFELKDEFEKRGSVTQLESILRREGLEEGQFLDCLAGIASKSRGDNISLLENAGRELKRISAQVEARLRAVEPLRAGLSEGLLTDSSFVEKP
jgi:NitT/TauT family transport system substrate-binding protein